MRYRSLLVLSLALILAGGTRPSAAAGILAPKDRSLPPLRVTDHLVDVTVHDGVAITSVTQTFRNDTRRRLEATYIFPLPEEADLTDFQMSFNGKMAQGRVLPKDEAARIYESIVRQSKDPGLIEFIGRRLLQMRVFPIEPESETTIEMRYQQICRPIGGMRAYHYPLRTRKTAGQAYGSVRFSLALETSAPLKSIWSPTHSVEIVRTGNEREARIGYEANGGSLEDDFLLLFDTDSSDLGMSVVAHKADNDQRGHFVLMLTPKQLWPETSYEPQDVVFVMDTSGSMSGEKIEQAKSALKFCIDRLDERDRFTIVRFSTGYDLLYEGLTEASPENRKTARRWVEAFSAEGGTNIADTMQRVAQLNHERALRESRSFVVVFLTDGRGNQPPEVTLNRLADAGHAGGMRVFPFGVGHKVNTKLLDRLAATYTGRTTYVQPGENLELVLGDFFSIISRPVLTQLRLELPAIGATERFPATLGDLYHGQQLILAGRFTDEVDGPVKLIGSRGGEVVEYVWPDVSFESVASADYVATVWAGRKIAYLIDQIRMSGESTEMIDEILALSQEHGIQTPYTSWLVDPERAVTRHRVAGRRAPGQGGFGLAGGGELRRRPLGKKRAPPGAGAGGGAGFGAGGGGSVFDEPGFPRGGDITYGDDDLQLDSALAQRAVTEAYGEAANLIARKNAEMKELLTRDQGRLDLSRLPYRKIGDRWYNRIGGLLVDEGFTEDTETVAIRFASPAYFELARARPDLRPVLAASRDVVVMMTSADAIMVSQRAGSEAFTDDDRRRFGLPDK